MTIKKTTTAFEALERIFHEPNRLEIMSILCAEEKGISFSDLKKETGMTDGNLNRHLKVLKESKSIQTKKAFINDKPRTTIAISKTGLKRFSEYLNALECVLKDARKSIAIEAKTTSRIPPAAVRTATA